MTFFEEAVNHHCSLFRLIVEMEMDGIVTKRGTEIINNSNRILVLYNEYIEKYGDYAHMSREQRFSANLLLAFDKELSMKLRLDAIRQVVRAYSMANNYTIFESLRFSLNHWRELPSVSDEEIIIMIRAFEKRVKDNGIPLSTIIDPFDTDHMAI